ncbi:MAG: TauD/TfdA family dioxygenase [Actinomycetota bacterium]
MAARSPVLVVSIDGVAPRHVTRATMPTLTTLALQGASCFRSRAVCPPWTLPVHTSMFRGVDPSAHGIADNTPVPLRSEAASFLKVARDAGLATASFVNWLPLDHVIERDAAEHRFVIDGGYGPDDDRRSVDAAIATLGDGVHDLVFVYLSQPDVDGHTYGWDSPEYVAAAGRSDALLGRLLDAVGDHARVLVTTDHGGIGTGHADVVPEVLETFVVVRAPGRVEAATHWPNASTLDIAPTVADLCGIDPDPRWEHGSLLGTETAIVDALMDHLAATAEESYGERVTMLDHALQSAALAQRDDAGEEMVLACLLHDIGHVLGDAGDWGDPGHSEIAARTLQAWLSPGIVEPIRHHVDAKRYRVTVEPEYHERLSVASQMSLQEQGGPLDPERATAFGALPFTTEAIALRAYDDDGKVAGLSIPSLETYRSRLAAALAAVRPIDPAWARDACRCAECRDAGNDQHLIDATALAGWTVISQRTVGDALHVLLHHASGERHACRIPADIATGLTIDDWPARFAETIRAESTDWHGDRQCFVDQLARRGIALFHGCGTDPETVTTVGNTVGFVRETNYGSLFDVVAEPDPINLAYTPLGLPAHTDNPYRRPCPTVQLLHCLVAADDGGASRFVDGFAVAEDFRRLDRAGFEILTTTDVTFRFHADGTDLRAKRPLIELDRAGAVHAVSVNNRSMEPLPPGDHRADAFYAAYRAFVELLDDDSHAIEITLRPGELVAFDNRRVLHGRRAFRSTARRHLQGCYIDIDAIRSSALAAAG